MSELLDGSTFGDKVYNKFPAVYRNEDVENDLFLKRYIDALGEGGFSLVIEDANGITKLISPSETEDKFLPTLYESYGISVFNGLPVKFLRSLFPYLSSLFSRKGSKSVISYLSSIILGARVKVEEDVNFKENYLLHLFVDVDSRIENDFPDVGQLKRVLGFFLPFFCKVIISYTLYDTDVIEVSFSELFFDIIYETTTSQTIMKVVRDIPHEVEKGILNDSRYTLNNNFYLAVSDRFDYNTILQVNDDFEDTFSNSEREMLSLSSYFDETHSGVLNSPMCTLCGNFYLSAISGYDIITKGKEQIIVTY